MKKLLTFTVTITIIIFYVLNSGCIMSTILISSALTKQICISKMTVEKGAIPPDFGTTTSTLICIIRERKGYDKYLKKHVRNEYHGKYTFATWDEFDTCIEYSDLDKYQYVFAGELHNSVYTTLQNPTNPYSTGPSGNYSFQEMSTTSETFYILDRKNNKAYPSPYRSSMFAKMIQAYMINLEKERIKKQR